MEFYSYMWMRANNESPYYVGKGCGRRAFINHGRIRPPHDKSRIFIFSQDNETDAFESERLLIWLFGRKDLGTGCLRNITDGGEGVSGLRHKADTRQRMSLSKQGKAPIIALKLAHTPAAEIKRHHTRQQKPNPRGWKLSAECIAKRIATVTGRKRPLTAIAGMHSLESRAKAGAKMRGRPQSADHIYARMNAIFIKTVAWG